MRTTEKTARFADNDRQQALTQEMWLTGQPYSVRRNYIYGNTIDKVLLMSDDIGRGHSR